MVVLVIIDFLPDYFGSINYVSHVHCFLHTLKIVIRSFLSLYSIYLLCGRPCVALSTNIDIIPEIKQNVLYKCSMINAEIFQKLYVVGIVVSNCSVVIIVAAHIGIC